MSITQSQALVRMNFAEDKEGFRLETTSYQSTSPKAREVQGKDRLGAREAQHKFCLQEKGSFR